MKKNTKIVLIFILALVMIITPATVQAKVLWRDGPNYVDNTETAQLLYAGLMYLVPDYVSSTGRKYVSGWIKYTSYADGRSAFARTQDTPVGVRLARLTFRDSIVWNAPKTEFSFDYNTVAASRSLNRDYTSTYNLDKSEEYLNEDVKIYNYINEKGENRTRGVYVLE